MPTSLTVMQDELFAAVDKVGLAPLVFTASQLCEAVLQWED